MWEATGASSGSVSWGSSPTDLSASEAASNVSTGGGALLFTVVLRGLQPSTRYYYRVTTGGLVDHVHDFITPPRPEEEASFNLVAMSDMQKDGSQPNKYHEVVHDGILDYFAGAQVPGDIAANLGFVLIPGDLVPNGNSHSQWQNDFFAPSDPLFSHVPVYPVLGNHENNSNFYFQYFSLPENGSAGYLEHWWYKDYSNVRIIGLNSNGGYRIQTQLDWLSGVLDAACQDEHIDFVFAQLHHPHLSELWTPGELDYTGEVISLLENFSTDCGKPSLHFFGHTHGYSRGQSRDHNHLWVNAATAGGAIDNWGEFPNRDYDEFSKSIDEYGFVVMNVSAGDDPEFTLQRISRGDQNVVLDNVAQDYITIRRFATAPAQPTGLYPLGDNIQPDCFIMQANAFADNSGFHQASHWQVASDCGDFTNPLVDSWKQHENLYDEVDTQADDDLTNETAGGLAENQTYCWRVRYRNEHLQWSDWSVPVTFTTGSAGSGGNQLNNGGGEDGTNGWSVTTGNIESLTSGACDGIAPRSGNAYLAVGGLCDGNETAYSEAYQQVAVGAFADAIAAGTAMADFGGYLSNFSGSDRPALRLDYLASNGAVLGSSATLTSLNNSWTLVEDSQQIPANTSSIRMILTGTRNAGTDNDSYFDDLFLRVVTDGGTVCSELSALPAELLSFTAVCNNRFVDLAWEVGAVANVEEYAVQRSNNGLQWERIGEVHSLEAAATRQRYTYRDFDRAAGPDDLYRLQIIDVDGSTEYSEVIAGGCAAVQPKVDLFPSPVTGGVLSMNVTSSIESQAELTVTNLLGQEVYRKDVLLERGTNRWRVPTLNWESGYYHFVLRSDYWHWTGKVVVH